MADVQASRSPGNSFKKPAKKKGLAVGVALALVAGAGMAWWGLQRTTGAAPNAAKSTLALETFVVNLTGSSQRAYLRVGITLELGQSLASRNPADAMPIAAIRDTILTVLATAQPEELLQSEGKRRLKDDLLKALQQQLPQIEVENVYFTEFLVQM